MQIHSPNDLLWAIEDMSGGTRIIDHSGLEMILIVRKCKLWPYWINNGRKARLIDIDYPVAVED